MEQPRTTPHEGPREQGSTRHGTERPPPPPPRGSPLDPSALFALLDGLRRSTPPELQERVTTLTREALLTARSLIDWYLEHLDPPAREPRVEDIPID